MNPAFRVERIDPNAVDEVIAVLADAFAGYPVIRFVLGAHGHEHHARLVRMFVMARVLRGEPLLGVRDGSNLVGAGIVSFPGAPVPPEFAALRAETWRVIGAEAEGRYTAYTEATKAFSFPASAVHLNMIGARRDTQRRGLGRSILDAVQAISRTRPGSPGVELTTETQANVAYYESRGFQLVGHTRVSPTLESWGFFRPNYIPIDCAVHDQLEAAATLGRTLAVTFEGTDGKNDVQEARIANLETRDGGEYLTLTTGQRIRLDRILAIDGINVRSDR